MKSIIIQALLITAAATLTACGAASNGSSGTPSSNLDQGVIAPIDEALFKGFVSSGTYQNQQVLSVDLAKGEFQVSVPLGLNVNLSLVDTPIKQLPGAHAYTATLKDGSKVLILAVPLKYSLKDLPTFAKAVLPSGDPLPGAVPGPLSTTSFALGGKDNVVLHLYFGSDTLGIFVETNFDPFAKIQADVLNKIRQNLGNLTLIPTKGTFRPGVYLAMTLPPKLARLLDAYVK